MLGKGRKHCWKNRKCWLPAFSSFPAVFSDDISFRVIKKLGLCSKGIMFSTLFQPGYCYAQPLAYRAFYRKEVASLILDSVRILFKN